MARGWPFVKPEGVPLRLFPQALSDQYRQLEVKRVTSNEGCRFNFCLTQSADVLVQITSEAASQKQWHRAGYLAAVLTGGPIADPIQTVERVFFGQQHLAIVHTGLDYYFEFWPHLWITDFQVELWAKQVKAFVIQSIPDGDGEDEDLDLLIGGELFTVDDIPVEFT